MEKFPIVSDKEDFNSRLQKFTSLLLQNTLGPDQMKKQLEQLEQDWPENRQHPTNILDFFYGIAEKMEEDYYYKSFRSFISHQAKQVAKSPQDLTPEEIQQIYAAFPEKEILEQKTAAALSRFEKASEINWSLGNVLNSDFPKILKFDLLFRNQERQAAGNESLQQKQALLEEFRKFIPDIKSGGIRAECALMWIIRDWALRNKKEHLVSVNHELPQIDTNKKVDLVIHLGDTINNVQLKALSRENYLQEHNQRIIDQALGYLKGTNISLLILDSRDIRDILQLTRKTSLTNGEKSILGNKKNGIIRELSRSIKLGKKYLESSSPKEKTPNGSTPNRQKIIDQFSGNKDLLLDLKYLNPKDAANMEKYLEAKNKFATDIAASSREVYLDLIDYIKNDLKK